MRIAYFRQSRRRALLFDGQKPLVRGDCTLDPTICMVCTPSIWWIAEIERREDSSEGEEALALLSHLRQSSLDETP